MKPNFWRLQFTSIQLHFIYIVAKNNNYHLKVLYVRRPYNISSKTQQPNNQTNCYEQALGDSGKEKNPFNKKKPPTEPGSGRGSRLS